MQHHLVLTLRHWLGPFINYVWGRLLTYRWNISAMRHRTSFCFVWYFMPSPLVSVCGIAGARWTFTEWRNERISLSKPEVPWGLAVPLSMNFLLCWHSGCGLHWPPVCGGRQPMLGSLSWKDWGRGTLCCHYSGDHRLSCAYVLLNPQKTLSKMLTSEMWREAIAKSQHWCPHGRQFACCVLQPHPGNRSEGLCGGGQEGRLLVVTTESSPLSDLRGSVW